MKSIAAVAATLLAGANFAHAAPVVMNGGFDQNTLSTQTATEIAGQTNNGNFVTGWTVSGTNPYDIYFIPATTTANPSGLQTNVQGQYTYTGQEYLRANAKADPYGTGGNFIGLDGDPSFAGPISQTINGFTVGKQYSVNFDWAASQLASRTGQTTEQIAVSLIGATSTETHDTALVTNPDSGFTGWFQSSLTFTATAASETLQFMSIGAPAGLPPIALLDNVSISTVPEPASLALLGAGLIGVGMFRRRRA